jgi:hypothetical protein
LEKNGLLKLTIGYCTIWNIRDEVNVTLTTIEKVTSESKSLDSTLLLDYTNYRREETRAATTGNR